MTDNHKEKNTRLKLFRKELGLSQQQMASVLGLNRSNLSKIENNEDGRNVPKDTFYVLSDKFNLNPEWWETGTGEMIVSNDNSAKKTNNPPTKTNGVPFFDLDVTATITGSYMDSGQTPDYYIDFKPFNDCDAYARVYGDSMYPKYGNGEIIAIKRIYNLEAILWGEAYMVVTDSEYDNLRTIKTVHPYDKDEEYIVLRASNPNFKGDTKIKKRNIIGMFIVKGKTRIDHG
ncbi:helix-turn-helix domain-containing protein [Sphingobacterium sp. UT-1RO-CII-1]|uniref:helix-turn-helix domain-containing protein n=1 Tax=Sphingobacterium sp. UT-1RO-CII-1 TaxID=2995225 RepID=UPI00227D24EE|nr:helix-turn-helix domain-containing protein [Sphingobacterium sp. UT-1RO-CII-1]MCY4781681.1 helix-turn-helix domain-containing protein [Sphingobacterium sp. UT-1RO-CII-1]